MKILVTGGQGELGQALSQALTAQGEDFASFGRGALDVSSQTMVQSFVEEACPEIIVNCAAYTGVDAAETDQDNAHRINALGPLYLAQAASQADARFFHISTDYVFDGLKPIPNPYFEDDPVNPLSVYGQTKADGERNALEHCEKTVIIRTSWLYGPVGRNFVKTMCRLGRDALKPTLKVVDDQIGAPTAVDDLAKQIIKLIAVEDFCGIAHGSSKGHTSWFGFARAIFEAFDIDKPIDRCSSDEFKTAAIRPFNSILSHQRLTDAQSDVMPHWREGLQAFVEAYKGRV